MWSISELMKKINNSLPIDIRLLPYDARLNEAWAVELESLDLINNRELVDIQKRLPSIVEKYRGCKELPQDEDVHLLVERELTDALGETGEKIHQGKSRNDQVVTDLMMFLRDSTRELKKSLIELGKNLTNHAERNIEVIMPGYTHLMQAQPIRLSHYLLSFAASVYDDIIRLDSYVENNLSECPLGSGALAGSTLKINRRRLAESLGFKRPSINSIKSVSDRAFVTEFAAHLSIIAMHLSRYAEDLIIWNSKEFGFVKLSDPATTGSSMMPQKRNPDSLELIRGLPGRIYGGLIGLLTISKGVPLTYAKDLQDDKRFIFEVIDATLDGVRLLCEVLKGISFDKDRMFSAIGVETLATDKADELVKKGMPFRKAYEVVSASIKNGLYTTEVLPQVSVENRSLEGGTSLKSVEDQIKFFKTIFTY